MAFTLFERVPLRGIFNKRLAFTVAILALSQFNFGFDNSAFGDIQAMDQFAADFGTMGPNGVRVLSPSWLSLFNGFSVLGFFTGVLVGNRISEKYGRRFTVRTMCCWTIICATILVTARHRDQMLVGRTLNHIYTGMELAVVPLYQAEITPLPARGAVIATYNTALVFGGLIMSFICLGTSNIPGRSSYLLPLGLFYVIPSIVFACTFFMPESPRWLTLRDRHEEALEALRRLRVGAFSEQQILEEMSSIRVACEGQDFKPSDINLFARWARIWSRKHIKRTLIVLGTNFFLHGTGNAFSTRYGTLFFKSLGTMNPFALSSIQSVAVLCVSVLTLFLVDWVGRRPLLIVGSFVQLSGLLIMGGLGMLPRSFSATSGIIATKMLFALGYTAAWGQLSHTITAELPAAEVRDLTYATGSLLAILTQAAVTFGLPYLLNEPYAALGAKVGFIFGGITVFAFFFAIFCVPECTGKSLEEIDILFNSKVPVRKFKEARIVTQDSQEDFANAKIQFADGRQAQVTVVGV